jgi:hypothetical protein
MTIRALMFATLTMAVAFSLLGWNWGIAVFAAACIPLIACLSVRKYLSRFKALRVFAFTTSIILIYLFSHGPYIAFLEMVYGNDDTPPFVDAITRTVYAPHRFLVDGPNNTLADSILPDQAGPFISAYNMEWLWFGGDFGVFVRALFSTG